MGTGEIIAAGSSEETPQKSMVDAEGGLLSILLRFEDLSRVPG
jgi:hypothetical protein